MILDEDTTAPATTRPFGATRRLGVAEHFRIPYATEPAPADRRLEHLCAETGAMLLWPSVYEPDARPVAAWIEDEPDGGIPIFARVLGDGQVAQLLARQGGEWRRAAPLCGARGERVGSIWTERSGSVLVPFDPDEVCECYLSESYLELVLGSGRSVARRSLMRSYYRVRRLLPRTTQIWLRRNYAHIQARTPFPSWPVETALHDFFELMAGLIAGLAHAPAPRLATWPGGRSWALVLTHDVETAAGQRAIEPVLELERSLGVRSAWNFVPDRYSVDEELVRSLTADGFEVGVHGLRHDGGDLRSLAELRRRLPAMRVAAERWGAVGFRSPSMHRKWDWMPSLGFEYDSSYPDTDPFEPQCGGCCSWLPFFNDGMVELPVTMPQDHTLFVILDAPDESAWIEKASFLRSRGGMALVLTHPDYLVNDRIMSAYRRFLEHFAGDETAWNALPREINRWWRDRTASTIETTAYGWRVAGPAASEAVVEFVEPANRW